MTGALDGLLELALTLRAEARALARQDLGLGCQEALQVREILVVDLRIVAALAGNGRAYGAGTERHD